MARDYLMGIHFARPAEWNWFISQENLAGSKL